MLVKTIPAGTTEKFQLNYVPERLLIRADDTNTDIRNLIAVKVTPLGVGVICDLDERGVSIIDSINKIGGIKVAGETYTSEIPLADGLVPDRVTDYEIKNGSAKAIHIYAPVSKKATLYVKSMQQTLLANSQVIFDKFAFLGFSAGGTHQATVDTEDGTSHTYSFTELGLSNQKRSLSGEAVIYNDKGTVKKVTVIPNTQLTGYKLQYIPL